MPTQVELARQAKIQFEIKGTVWNGRLRALEKYCSLTEIRGLVSAETRKLMDDPPPASSWVPGVAIVELDAAIYDTRGSDICARCSRETSEIAGTTVLRTLAEGLLRLFGMSPSTIFERMGQVSSTSVRGIEYEYKSTGPTSGKMFIRYTHCVNVPYAVFSSISGGMAAIFGFLQIKGHVSPPELSTTAPHNSAIVTLRW
jgi:hypothetical protein